MHSIIHPTQPSRTTAPATARPFRRPHYDCQDQTRSMRLVVYVPGVEAAGVEIAASGPDLEVTARKPHPVRVNWQALHLESAQRDYQLRLRLGLGFDYEAMHATLRDGVLEIELPKRPTAPAVRSSLLDRLTPPSRHRQVA